MHRGSVHYSKVRPHLFMRAATGNATFLIKCNFLKTPPLMQMLNWWPLFWKKKIVILDYKAHNIRVIRYVMPLTCQSLSTMFCVYSHHDIWSGHKEKQLCNCFKEPRSKEKGFRKWKSSLSNHSSQSQDAKFYPNYWQWLIKHSYEPGENFRIIFLWFFFFTQKPPPHHFLF